MYFYICLSCFLNQFNKCHVQWSFIFIKEVFWFCNSSWGKMTVFSVAFGLFLTYFTSWNKFLHESQGFISAKRPLLSSDQEHRAFLQQGKFINLGRWHCVLYLVKSLFVETISCFSWLPLNTSYLLTLKGPTFEVTQLDDIFFSNSAYPFWTHLCKSYYQTVLAVP